MQVLWDVLGSMFLRIHSATLAHTLNKEHDAETGALGGKGGGGWFRIWGCGAFASGLGV